MDVTDEKSMEVAMKFLEERLTAKKQPLVALVNNAGISFSMPMEFVPMQRARALFDVNVFGLIRMTQLCLPLLRAHKGRVISVGSVAGLVASPGHGTYSASKHAVEAISDALRVELGAHGVSVSIIEPGFVQTAINEKSFSADAPFRSVTPAQAAVYPVFFAGYEKARAASFVGMPFPSTSTTPAIVDAITNTRPSARYLVSNVGTKPAWFVARYVNHLPVRVRDAMLSIGFHGPPK